MKKVISRTFIVLFIGIPLVVAGFIWYALATLNIEHLILCATDDTQPRTAQICEYYLLNFRGTKEDIAALEQRGIGITFTLVVSAKHADRFKLSNFLISKEINVNTVSPLSGFTPLHTAVIENDANMTKYLLDHGATIDIKSKSDRLPDNLTPLELVDELIQTNPEIDRSAVRNLLIAK